MLSGLNHLTLATGDLDRSFAFYVDLLGFRPRVKWDRGAYLSVGDLWLCLSCDAPHPANDYSHIAFSILVEHFPGFCARLRQAGIEEWKRNSSEGIRSISKTRTGINWRSMWAILPAASPHSERAPTRA